MCFHGDLTEVGRRRAPAFDMDFVCPTYESNLNLMATPDTHSPGFAVKCPSGGEGTHGAGTMRRTTGNNTRASGSRSASQSLQASRPVASDPLIQDRPRWISTLVAHVYPKHNEINGGRPGTAPVASVFMRGLIYDPGSDDKGREVFIRAIVPIAHLERLKTTFGALGINGYGIVTKKRMGNGKRVNTIYTVQFSQGQHGKFTVSPITRVPLNYGAVRRMAHILDIRRKVDRMETWKSSGKVGPCPKPLKRMHVNVADGWIEVEASWTRHQKEEERRVIVEHNERMRSLQGGMNGRARTKAVEEMKEQLKSIHRERHVHIYSQAQKFSASSRVSRLMHGLASAIVDNFPLESDCDFYPAEVMELVHPTIRRKVAQYINKHPLDFALNRTIRRVPKKGSNNKALDVAKARVRSRRGKAAGDTRSARKMASMISAHDAEIAFGEVACSDMESGDEGEFILPPGATQAEMEAVMEQRAAERKRAEYGGSSSDDDGAIDVGMVTTESAEREYKRETARMEKMAYTINVDMARKDARNREGKGTAPKAWARFKQFYPRDRCIMTTLPILTTERLSNVPVGLAALSRPGVRTALAIYAEANKSVMFNGHTAFKWSGLTYRMKTLADTELEAARQILVGEYNSLVELDVGEQFADRWGDHKYYAFAHRDRIARALCGFLREFNVRAHVTVQRHNEPGSKTLASVKVPWPHWAPDRVHAEIHRVMAKHDLRLDDVQQKAVFDILTKPGIHTIQGAGGTGKTTAMRAVHKIICSTKREANRVVLMGPTATAKETIGHALGIPSHAHTMNAIQMVTKMMSMCKPEKVTHVFIDEASMIYESMLMFIVPFMKRLPNVTTLVFLGDHRQISPIREGNVFRDLRACEWVHSHTFTKVYRTDRLGISNWCNAIADGKFDEMQRAHNKACSLASGWKKGEAAASSYGDGLRHMTVSDQPTVEEVTEAMLTACSKSIEGGISRYDPETLRVIAYKRVHAYGPIVNALRIAAHHSRKTPASQKVNFAALTSNQFVVGDFVRCTKNTRESVKEPQPGFYTDKHGNRKKRPPKLVEHIRIYNGFTGTIVGVERCVNGRSFGFLPPDQPFHMAYDRSKGCDLKVHIRSNLQAAIQFGFMSKEAAHEIKSMPMTPAGIREMQRAGAYINTLRFSKNCPPGEAFLRGGYSSTSHSSQGQQFPSVVALFQPGDQQDVMYTASSRASKSLVVISSGQAIRKLRKRRPRLTVLGLYLKYESLLPMESDSESEEESEAESVHEIDVTADDADAAPVVDVTVQPVQ